MRNYKRMKRYHGKAIGMKYKAIAMARKRGEIGEVKYYAVANGRENGIFYDWDSCKEQVHKFPGAIYKSFPTEIQCHEFIQKNQKWVPPKEDTKIVDNNNTKTRNLKLFREYSFLTDTNQNRPVEEIPENSRVEKPKADSSANGKSKWMTEIDLEIEEKWKIYDNDELTGKWLMYFPWDIMDEKWDVAVKLYHSRKLTGIQSMKRSLQPLKYPIGVIMFYCGPDSDKELMKSYGKNLLKLISYTDSKIGFMYKGQAPIFLDVNTVPQTSPPINFKIH